MLKGVLKKLVVLLLLLVAAAGNVVYWLVQERYPLVVVAGIMLIICAWLLIKVYFYNTRKLTFMFSAIENDDYTFRFTESGGAFYDNFFNMALNRIKDLLLKARDEAKEREKYYELILSSVITGVVVINERGNVFQTNAEALRLLDMAMLTHVDQLYRVDESLPALLLDIKSGDSQGITVQNERGTTHLTLQASDVEIRGKRLKIIAINDIDRQLDEKELESWVRLTRVLTHEIMNAITPVTSLSDTLLNLVDVKSEDVRNGLEVINATSKGLIDFVESYRSFTRIPDPDLRLVDVKPLLERLVRLAAEDPAAAGVAMEIKMESDDLMIQADEGQISQVILNLLRNAAAAIGPQPNGRIRIEAYCDRDENVVIEIANNGAPIPLEVADQIFVPFFTTKNEGSGIGLSISRQIMRVHRGSIKLLYSNEKETAFALVFR